MTAKNKFIRVTGNWFDLIVQSVLLPFLWFCCCFSLLYLIISHNQKRKKIFWPKNRTEERKPVQRSVIIKFELWFQFIFTASKKEKKIFERMKVITFIIILLIQTIILIMRISKSIVLQYTIMVSLDNDIFKKILFRISIFDIWSLLFIQPEYVEFWMLYVYNI